MARDGKGTAGSRLTGLAGRLGAALLEVALPRVCISCGADIRIRAGLVCDGCWARIPTLPYPRCPRCGHPTAGLDCRWCDLLPPYVRAVRSVCWERSGTTAQSVIHALKYGGWPAIAADIAAQMARVDWPLDVVRERAAVVAVPLSPTRARERGFNQSDLLARALSAHWSMPVWTDALERVRHTESQTRLTPADRVRNVAGAFRASRSVHAILRGAHVILVDDVVTTASTLNACAAALFEGGARILSYVTFGRAPAAGDRC
ncbi:MAG TPA: ComF family protein [Gemmatimonadaceae bacterium]